MKHERNFSAILNFKIVMTIAAVLLILAQAAPAHAVTEFVTVVKVLGENSGIVERKNGDRWHIEVGPEASFFWRYEGKQARIKSASTFCGPGVRILLPEDRQEASVWNARLIGNSDNKGGVRAAGGEAFEENAGYAGSGYDRFRAEYDGKTVESAIDGRFDGWKGGTVVKLKSGEIWRQKRFYYHHYRQCGPLSPKVTIYKLGPVYKMQVEGVPKAVEVEELE
ncbi:MAG: hypothetical protein A2008_08195 [Candidatus Wallbacteria bacterium GWC2_49_35]|uniref:Uncharacterized protein n=1 Tax=Candidatus Wallbacteria bacterium GWC2_49_35 TaxID=1817813 RepID=A0A1F7WNR4_9BACT|nr:MAG: hypothetical protein A2008_08195 [Candidatus Wallbacteria bacterium GWC2_49_35]HBC76473.1 hypothetical protein [Candidatus Wallbacteria bacterium]